MKLKLRLIICLLSIVNILLSQSKYQDVSSSGMKLLASNQRSDTVNILKYTINMNITDFTNSIISGNTEVKFTPKINGINYLNLDLLVLTIDSVTQGTSLLTYNYNDTLLHIHLPAAYNINDTISVKVFYHGTPQIDHPSQWGGFYFQSGYAFNLGVGFDALPHTFGRAWFPCFDNFVERSKYEFNITTDTAKTSYCNGFLANDTVVAGGNRIRKWIMNEEIPSYLACVAVAGYAEIHQTYNGANGATPIVIAALPADTANVKASFINLPLAISTFENHFGPYMWNKVGYSMVPFNSGAMEHATNITYPRALATGSTMYQTTMAHELSHHWFGDLATCRTAEDMWLNEGWATYCEYLFTEALSGYPTYLSDVRSQHQLNLQFIQHKEGGYQTLSNIPSNITYGDHVYKKGADVAHTLRGYMGDSLFFYSVKTYLSQNNFKDVSSADFRDALSLASGTNMNDFFDGWVFNPGWPHFSIDSTTSVQSGSDYNVTVYVKQKLTGAPNYFNNVPLEITFKKADWTEQTQSFIMSGANGVFNFTVPFNPAFIAVNMGEKISHAVAPDYKKLKNLTNTSFTNAKMIITPISLTDSVFVRVEHNYTAPDAFHSFGHPYRLSPNHYWKVDGILPAGFKAKATLNYEARTIAFGGNYWLDNDLLTTGSFEDSLVLMYRRNAAADWAVYPYYSKNILGSNTDGHGIITIDTFQLGEYVFAMKDYTAGIQNNSSTDALPAVICFPNPANEHLTICMNTSQYKMENNSLLTVTDITGKMIYKEKINSFQNNITLNTSAFSNGMYFINLKTKDAMVAKGKFIVEH